MPRRFRLHHKLCTDLVHQGFEIRQSKRNGHLKVFKDGRMVCVIAESPGGGGLLKTIANLRQHGFTGGCRDYH